MSAKPYRLASCVQGRHTECPEFGPSGSADVPGMSCEADVCECLCHEAGNADLDAQSTASEVPPSPE